MSSTGFIASEQLDWYDPAALMPDPDTTVVVRIALPDGEPVWLGYYDGMEWQSVDGNPIDVLAWADMPGGPKLREPKRCTATYEGLLVADHKGTRCCRPAKHEGEHRGSNSTLTVEWE